MINSKNIIQKFSIALIAVTSYSCTEAFDFENEISTFDSAIVIEATITNEDKVQEILLSRVFPLSVENKRPESNAQVKVVDNANNEYRFEETDSVGTYRSILPFSAKKNKNYVLQVITNKGTVYQSEVTRLTQNTKIDSLYAVRDYNEDGVEGVSIYVNSFDPTRSSNFYRHNYQETYKIIAPFWTNKDLIVISPPTSNAFGITYALDFVSRAQREQVCYNTVESNSINIISTINLNEDRLNTYRVRFISRENYIISHRYSILVNQYVQSREAQGYYKNLKMFSESESLFSENQPGFFEGNVFALDNNKDKVLGFFEVASVDSKRIYFNYEDFFPNEELPPYANGCIFDAPPLFNPLPSGSLTPLLDAINSGDFKYYDEHVPQSDFEGPALLVTRSCGDCTALGKSEAPEFWIE